MKQAVIDLFSSKKFIAMLVTAAVAIGAKLGFDLDSEMVALIVGLGATYITSQGLADHGKEAARIHAGSMAAEPLPMPANDNEPKEVV